MNTRSDVFVVVTGSTWIGQRTRSVLSAAREMLRSAQHEVLMAVYTITGGVSTLIDELVGCLMRGVRVKILVDRFSQQPPDVQEVLRDLQRYVGFELWSFEPETNDEYLHTKTLVVDGTTALVGSANFSRHGLTTSHEMGVVLFGRAARHCHGLLQVLFHNARSRRL